MSSAASLGAVGQGLSDQDKKNIRKVLVNAHEPLMIGAIAGRAGLSLNTPVLQQQVSDFISGYLVEIKEAELVLDGMSRKTGRGIFRGFRATDNLRNLVSKGLA